MPEQIEGERRLYVVRDQPRRLVPRDDRSRDLAEQGRKWLDERDDDDEPPDAA